MIVAKTILTVFFRVWVDSRAIREDVRLDRFRAGFRGSDIAASESVQEEVNGMADPLLVLAKLRSKGGSHERNKGSSRKW